MTWSPDSSITGAAQTGLTNPTYTLVDDQAPDTNGKAKAVSALGGTQTNVRANSGGDPFKFHFFRPKVYKSLPPANANTGINAVVPKNTYGLKIYKGLKVNSDAQIAIGVVTLTWDLPAGCETNDAINVRALNSLLIGLLTEEADDVSETLLTNVIS